MENFLVTYGFNKNVIANNFLKERLPLIASMLFVSKNISLEKMAFMNSSCFVICELNWIVFMAIVKYFHVKNMASDRMQRCGST